MIDMVTPRSELKATLARLLGILTHHAPLPASAGGAAKMETAAE
jgi:acetyl-CoA carboxylase beta subunit